MSDEQLLRELIRITGAVKFANEDWRLPFFYCDGTSELLPSDQWISRRKEAAINVDRLTEENRRLREMLAVAREALEEICKETLQRMREE